MPPSPAPNRKCHQGVAAGIDAERQRAHRILPQGHEGAAPGRTDQPPGREQRARGARSRNSKIRVPRSSAIRARQGAGCECRQYRQSAIPRYGKPDTRTLKTQRHEREIMVLNPQRRKSQHEPTRSRRRQTRIHRESERPAVGRQIGRDVSPNTPRRPPAPAKSRPA